MTGSRDPLAADPVAAWRRLAAEARTVLLDGFHPVKHALRFGAELPMVIAADPDQALDLAGSLAPDLVARLRAVLVRVDANTVAGLVGRRQHTGVAALARRPELPLAAVADGARPAPLVLLDNPRQLGNLGAAVRVAAGLGAAGVVSTGTADPWHPDAVRGSAGLHFAVPTRRIGVDDVDRLGGPLLAVDPDGTDARELAIPDNAVLAFGSERRGLPEAVIARADVRLAIPMRAGVSSYNLATSVAMVLYQWALSRR